MTIYILCYKLYLVTLSNKADKIKKLRSELKRGTFELILLKLLDKKEMYGYEIVTALEKKGGELFQVKEGTLYPILYRLEDNGYISSYRDNPFRGVPRKYYKLTDSGKDYLEKLIMEWDTFSKTIRNFLKEEVQNHE